MKQVTDGRTAVPNPLRFGVLQIGRPSDYMLRQSLPELRTPPSMFREDDGKLVIGRLATTTLQLASSAK
jgi:hypothetical protein